jgi:5-methylcytosine-specific restriction endonuclease McrA
VVLLSAHLKLLTREAGRELLRAAVNKRQREIRLLLAERFPQPDTPTMLVPIAPVPSAPSFRQLCSNIVAGNGGGAETPSSMSEPVALAASTAPMPVQVGITDTHPVTPLAPGRLALHTTVDLETEDLVREAHELLGHPTATSHVPEVLKAAMQLYVAQLRKQKFADTDKPRTSGARSEDSRHIPAGVRREVWKRDQGQCTYVSPSGHRCQERCGLQYDHIVPYAQGGAATAGNVRLLCQTHNQLEAERTYGAGFMEHKREQAREQARERRKAG